MVSFVPKHGRNTLPEIRPTSTTPIGHILLRPNHLYYGQAASCSLIQMPSTSFASSPLLARRAVSSPPPMNCSN